MKAHDLALAAALIGAALPGAAGAQAISCAIPRHVARPLPDNPTPSQPQRNLAIGSYTLALTWSPEYCRTRQNSTEDRFQCGSGNRFGFTLHGLWPDGYGAKWPQYCRPARILPQSTIRANLCATPSAQLIQHEWAKHGTCMTTRPETYFAEARAHYTKIRYPDMDALSRLPNLTVAQFSHAFAAANPGLTPAMFRVTGARGWLDEVWICMNRQRKWTRCPTHQKGLGDSARLKIWRGR